MIDFTQHSSVGTSFFEWRFRGMDEQNKLQCVISDEISFLLTRWEDVRQPIEFRKRRKRTKVRKINRRRFQMGPTSYKAYYVSVLKSSKTILWMLTHSFFKNDKMGQRKYPFFVPLFINVSPFEPIPFHFPNWYWRKHFMCMPQNRQNNECPF